MLTPDSIEELQTVVQSAQTVKIIGGGTKPALSTGGTISTRGLSGVLQYEPSEYTFTALAGTPIREIETMLTENGQFLPFDPPFGQAGATIGGTVAAGLSGPGRFRYGGVRDFLLGVRLVTGAGRVVFGGAKVVKNAAGFDLPKLLVGTLGRWGVLVELTFKVFPAPDVYRTLKIELSDFAQAQKTHTGLAMSQFDLTCLDWEPPQRIWVRIGGLADSLEQRATRLKDFVKADAEIIGGIEDSDTWRAVREFDWVPAGHGLIKVPLVPGLIPEFEQWLNHADAPIPRRYSVGGNVAWIARPDGSLSDGDFSLASELSHPALALRGQWKHPLIGAPPVSPFAERLLSVFDPEGKCGL